MAQKILDRPVPQSRHSTSSRPFPQHQRQSLPSCLSLFLDIVRSLAALTVAIGHLSVICFPTSWSPILLNCAEGAVAVFFVLSGFMIRYITSVKYTDLRRFTVDRISRIYSVAIPAVALTILLDLVTARLNPTYYAVTGGDTVTRMPVFLPFADRLFEQAWLHGLFRVVLSLTMLSQSWFHDSSLLSNSPFWSLSYECVYYALFGIVLYLRGRRRVIAVIVVFLLIGPTIFLMLPLWLLGCAAYDASQDGVFKKSQVLNKKSQAKLLSLALLSVACVHGTRAIVGHFHAHWFYIGRMTPWMDTAAIATVAVVLLSSAVLRNLSVSEAHPAVRLIRKLAAATFPLYLIHLPLFVLVAAAVPYSRTSLWARFVILGSAITLSILFTGPCDAFKDYLRNKLRPTRTTTLQAAVSAGKRPVRA